MGGQNVIKIFENRKGTEGFAPLRDRLVLGPGTAAAVRILIVRCFFSKIVFHEIYKNRKGTVRFALLRDRFILAARSAGAVRILVFDVSFKKSFSVKFTRIVRAR